MRSGALLVLALGMLALAALAFDSAPVEEQTEESFELLSDVARKKLKEAVKLAGKAPTATERAHIQHVLSPIAKHLATRMLYTEVAERARANPTKPGHHAMEQVLASSKEENEIEARVKNRMANIHAGQWAEEIYRKVPSKFQKLIPALATQAAHTATTNAFSKLKHEMLMAEKNPTFMKHLKYNDPNA
eukprot:CAMPEP_0184296160 /NCGR_PEP_ID=MMETSP1049-20130417/7121_1 /TAXON_ID=77928 /ORGANISM="Proteomonas sulcata, Strain CCMP704" /LENGTH=188 /DNA_ID=CAMNT_0026605207 /DNA_START=78 /DNA_END=644 /DNA_ORIENTATION=+